MNKYAEIYGGKVRDVRTSSMGHTDWCSIWAPTSYWIDVTGIADIQPGYIVQFDANRGTYFTPPPEAGKINSFGEEYPLWKPMTAYPSNYRVRYDEYVYESNFEHISSADQPPDTNKTCWTLLDYDSDIPIQFYPGIDVQAKVVYAYAGVLWYSVYDMPECRYIPSDDDSFHWQRFTEDKG